MLGPPWPDHRPETGRRLRSDYKRCERSKAMDLWEMDIVGGARLADGSQAKIVTGVDDHTRICISAYVVGRAMALDEPLEGFGPPLLLVIDEAATLRPDQLPPWASTLSGVGVQLVTAWQSIAQIKAAYGRQAQAILTNNATKLFFPGMSDAAGLDYLSRLLGDEHVPSRLGGQPGKDRHRSAITSVPPGAAGVPTPAASGGRTHGARHAASGAP